MGNRMIQSIKHTSRWFGQLVGEVVVGVVEFGLVLAATHAEHGTRKSYKVLGKVLTPTEWQRLLPNLIF